MIDFDADFGGAVAAAMEAVRSHHGLRRHRQSPLQIVVSPESQMHWEQGVSDTRGTAVVRQVLTNLGFDEERLFRFRFDHKLAHIAVALACCPLPMPRSIALDAFLAAATVDELRDSLARVFPGGYVIKPCLGCASGDSGEFDVRASVFRDFEALRGADRSQLPRYLVQERIAIIREFRVHTVEDQLVEPLTCRRYSGAPIPAAIRDALWAFVRDVLRTMPDGLISDTFCGWDVAQTDHGFVVVEINYTGFHPEFARGYQTSGYVQGSPAGLRRLGVLLEWLAENYRCRIEIEPDRKSVV